MNNDQTAANNVADSKVLRESGVHKLIIADREGRCLAYLLAWDSFEYDADTDTYVCVVDRDGRELLTIYAEGEVRQEAGTDRRYVVTAPVADLEPRLDDSSWMPPRNRDSEPQHANADASRYRVLLRE